MSDADQSDDETVEATGDAGELDDMESLEELVAEDGLSTRQEYQMRFALAETLGENLAGDDDYYDVFDWDKDPGVDEFYALALRNPYAYAVTFLRPEMTWRNPPQISDRAEATDDSQTQFESDVQGLVDDLRLWHYCRRADKLAGIGKFGALVLEFDDTDDEDDFSTPVDQGAELTGLKPFSRASISEVKIGSPGSGRWNEPNKYLLDFSDENEYEDDVMSYEGEETVWVHWQRVIHIPSDELLDDELRGIERQRPVYNNIIDIERSLGSAGKLAYRAAAWGLNINIAKDFELEDGGDKLRENLKRWQNGLENVLRTQGAEDVQSLGGEDIDPQPIIDPNIEAISAQTGIPQSVLKGNETGERATSQDLKELYGRIAERQNTFSEPQIVRDIFGRLMMVGTIASPSGDGYLVDWPPLEEMSEADQADIRETRAGALETWLKNAPGVLTPEQQLEFIRDGTLPTELQTGDLPPLDEADAAVTDQFEQMGFGTPTADD